MSGVAGSFIRVRALAVGSFLLMLSPWVLAQESGRGFPVRAITMIVPYAAGGSSDVRARQLAQRMARELGQPVIVENKPGANGNIGTQAIAKAPPDGYTIGIGNLAPLTVNKTLFPKTPFDPVRDLEPIVLIEKGPLVLVVNAEKSPHKDLKALVQSLRDTEGKMSYASAGSGGSFHLAGELFKLSANVSALHVPYRGGALATNDLLAGQVDYMFDMVPASLSYLKGNPPKFRALAVANDKRLPLLPDVPTFSEWGYKDMSISNWFGVVTPKGTPALVIEKLNKTINNILQEPEMAQRITSTGNLVGGGSAKEFAEFISKETQRWTRLIQDKGIQAD